MELHFLDRSSRNNISFTIKKNNAPYFLRVWHYHSELELVYVTKSSGTRFIGDSIDRFEEGEVILIGKNLPHMWLNDDEYFCKTNSLTAKSIAIYFNQEFLGASFLQAPELKKVNELLEQSRFGIKFDNLHERIKKNIEQLETSNDFNRLIRFLNLLNDLANHKEKTTLASEGYLEDFGKSNNKKLEKVYQYIFNNFNRKVSLTEVAEVASMNPSAFSRFFKKVNRKTFKEYVNEIRIGYSCKLLSENQYNITRICYESGFNNISNFNRQFKKIIGKSPSEYLKHHKKIVTDVTQSN